MDHYPVGLEQRRKHILDYGKVASFYALQILFRVLAIYQHVHNWVQKNLFRACSLPFSFFFFALNFYLCLFSLLYGSHVAPMWHPCGVNVASMWFQCGSNVALM